MNRREMKQGYCNQCDLEVPVEVREESQTNNIKNVEVNTIVQNVYCVNCGAEVYIPQLNDANLDRIDKSFRELTNTITVDEINGILKKYSIGAKPLSLLLNWGECTIFRYTKGQIPNKEHNRKLKTLENPHDFYDLFKKNRGSLTNVACKKIEMALSDLIDIRSNEDNLIAERALVDYFTKTPNKYNGNTVFNLKKLINTILFFPCKYGEGIYKTKLNKLLWYSDMLCFKKYSHAITGLCYQHNYYGPIPLRHDWIFGSLSEFYIQFDETDYGEKITSLRDFDPTCFSEEELSVLEYTGERFKMWKSGELSDYSHKEVAYKNTSQGALISFDFAKDLSLT